jgi:soluble lytic murein transglycosylase-like protein
LNPLLLTVGVPLALFSALMLLARPADAPGRGLTPGSLLKLPGRHWHIASPEITKRLKGAYPETVAELSGKWSRVFDTPISWLRSQAYAESKNVLTVVNAVTGAAGVLQILPATAKWLVKSLRKSAYGENQDVVATLKNGWRGHPGDLLNPDLNVMLAAYYMLLLRKKFGDDHDVVAAAYNLGPNKIAYYLRTRRPFPRASLLYIAMVRDAKLRGFT